MIARIRITWTIATVGFVQLIRSRIYLNVLVAGIALVVASLVLEEVSAGEGGRVLHSLGLAFASLVVAAMATIVPIATVTRELETKEAHLMLARPIARGEFVVGRFLTTTMLVVASNVVLGGAIAGLLVATGSGQHASSAFVAALFQSLEGIVLAAVALFFGVSSSSTVSAVFVATFFVLGRLTGELLVLIEAGKFGAATSAMKAIYAVLPHLAALDLTALRDAAVPWTSIASAAAYAIAYALAFLAFAVFRINRRDLL